MKDERTPTIITKTKPINQTNPQNDYQNSQKRNRLLDEIWDTPKIKQDSQDTHLKSDEIKTNLNFGHQMPKIKLLFKTNIINVSTFLFTIYRIPMYLIYVGICLHITFNLLFTSNKHSVYI